MKIHIRRMQPGRPRNRAAAIVFTLLLLVPGFLLNPQAAVFLLLLIAIAAVLETRASRQRQFSYNKLLPYLLMLSLGGLTCAQVLALLLDWLGRQPLAIFFFILAAPVLLLMFFLIIASGFVLLFSFKSIFTSIGRGRLSELWWEFDQARTGKKLLMLLVLGSLAAATLFYIYWLMTAQNL